MYKSYHKQISTHKFFECTFKTEKETNQAKWLALNLNWTTEVDQPGIQFEFSILKLIDVAVKVYDNRFWNNLTNTYHTDTSWFEYQRKYK